MERIIIECNGKRYERKQNGWTKEGHWELVEDRLQKCLNREYNRRKLTDPYDFGKLWEASGKYRDQGDFTNAIWCLKFILEHKTDKKNLSKILSRLSSCYRETNNPDEAISLYDRAKAADLYIDEAFLTSLGSACMDIYERDGIGSYLEKAKDFLDKAYGKSRGKSSPSLYKAYKRYDALCEKKTPLAVKKESPNVTAKTSAYKSQLAEDLENKNWAILSTKKSLPDDAAEKEKVLQDLNSVNKLGKNYFQTRYIDASGTDLDEESVLYYDISFRDALRLARKIGQEYIIYKQDGVCQKISTQTDVKSGIKASDIAVTFDLSGDITYKLMQEIFTARIAEPAVTMFEGNASYKLTDIMYVIIQRSSYFQTEKKYVRLEELL